MRILLVNQAFAPDVVSTAQHLTDLARALTARGHEVTVLTGRRAYDDPRRSFPAFEVRDGARVQRIWTPGLGKHGRWRRFLEFACFMIGAAFHLFRWQRFDVVVALTSPPLIAVLAALFVRVKGGRLVSWVMDLNPDEAVAAGWLEEGSWAVRTLSRALRFSLAAADRVVTLDTFMRDRVVARGVGAEKVVVLPPWAHDDSVDFDVEGRRRFRHEHGFDEKFVVMYSGNHSPCHPLGTLLEAARRLRDDPAVLFCFIGGGSQFEAVGRFRQQHGLENVYQLPYRPFEELSASLSSADLHVVVMGRSFVGIVHPCKIYNILAVGAPVLYVGPGASHVTEMGGALGGLLHKAAHGEVSRVIDEIRRAMNLRRALPQPRAQHLAREYSLERLLPRLLSLIEDGPSSQSQWTRDSLADERALGSL